MLGDSGEQIRPDDCASSLKLNHLDLIKVVWEQEGGSAYVPDRDPDPAGASSAKPVDVNMDGPPAEDGTLTIKLVEANVRDSAPTLCV